MSSTEAEVEAVREDSRGDTMVPGDGKHSGMLSQIVANAQVSRDDSLGSATPTLIPRERNSETAGGAGKMLEFPVEVQISPREYYQRFLAEQMWEGIVTRVHGDCFVARLFDARTDDEDEAELPVLDVSDDDKELLVPGASFYFSIGYEYSRAGNVQRCSRIRFRRVPQFTTDEILDAYQRAAARADRIQFE